MTSPAKVLLFAILIWLIPFMISFVIFPLRQGWLNVYESIMAVALIAITTFSSFNYFRDVTSNFLREAIIVGFTWLGVSIIIDLPIVMNYPINMSFYNYITLIAFKYLVIPLITISVGLKRRSDLNSVK